MEHRLRRSFVSHRLVQAGGQSGDDEAAAAKRMGLADLSLLPRIGYKGAGAPAWLRQHTVALPPQPNTAVLHADGTLVAALSQQEHLLLGALTSADNGVCRQLPALWSLDSAPRCYQQPRADSHCWFAVCGDSAGEMLAKLCGVDLRPRSFAVCAVAQTSLARVNAIIIRPPAAIPLFYLLLDNPSADCVWGYLLDAMAEFNGAVVGINALSASAG